MIYTYQKAQKTRQKQEELCPKGDDRLGHKDFTGDKKSPTTTISVTYLAIDKFKSNARAATIFFFDRK